MGESHERHEVMLAQRREGDVAHHDHLVVTGFEGDPQVFARIGFEAFEELDVHVGDASRRLDETLAVGVLADRFEQFADEALHARVVDHD